MITSNIFINNLTKIQVAIKTKLFKDTFIVFMSNILSRILNFALFLIIAKYLSVKEYAVLTVLLAVVLNIGDLINLGLNASVIRFTTIFAKALDYEKIARLFSTSLINLILITILLLITIVFSASALSNILFKYNYSNLLILSVVGVGITLVYGLYNATLQGLQNFIGLFYTSIVFSFSKLVSVLLLLYFNELSIYSVLLIFVLSPLVSILIASISLRKIKLNFLKYDISILKEMRSFGQWMVLWSIIVIVQSKMDIYILGPLSNPEQVSYFDIAQKFVSIIAIAIASFGTVLTPKLTMISDNYSALNRSMGQTKKLAMLITGVLIIFYFILPLIIVYIFNDKYLNSLLPLKIMLASMILYAWTIPFNAALNAMGKSKSFFLMAVIGLISNVIISFILVPRIGAVGSSISFAATNLIGLIFTYVFYIKYIKVQFPFGNRN